MFPRATSGVISSYVTHVATFVTGDLLLAHVIQLAYPVLSKAVTACPPPPTPD